MLPSKRLILAKPAQQITTAGQTVGQQKDVTGVWHAVIQRRRGPLFRMCRVYSVEVCVVFRFS